MNPLWGHVIGVVTVVLMLIICGIWVWAWLPHHKNAFDASARLPMRESGTPDQISEDQQ